MKYGYARVSTQAQSLGDQVEKLKAAGVKKHNIYKEKYTGTKSNRPEFDKLKSQLSKGDELVVTKLDRLGRSTGDVIDFLNDCNKQGVTVNILTLGKLDNSPSGKLLQSVMAAFAQFERDQIVARTSEGKAYAKKHNPRYREGRPKRTITSRYQKIFDFSQTHSIRETAEMTGVSPSTVYRIRKQVKSERATQRLNC